MYSYSYSGECELDVRGRYSDPKRCLAAGQAMGGPMRGKEMWYHIHCYDLDSTLQLAPSDRLAVLTRLTRVSWAHQSQETVLSVIEAIRDKNYDRLTGYPEILRFIRRRHRFSLTFTVGKLTEEQIEDFEHYDDTQLTSLAVANGIVLNHLRHGDIVKFIDIPLSLGSLVGYNCRAPDKHSSLGRTPYQGHPFGSWFNIGPFPRVDYFRYSLPGNVVRLKVFKVDYDQRRVVTVACNLSRIDLGRHRIFTQQVDRVVAEIGKSVDAGKFFGNLTTFSNLTYGKRDPEDTTHLFDLFADG